MAKQPLDGVSCLCNCFSGFFFGLTTVLTIRMMRGISIDFKICLKKCCMIKLEVTGFLNREFLR